MSRLNQAKQYYRTLRYLQPNQLIYRLIYALKPRTLKKVDAPLLRNWSQAWNGPCIQACPMVDSHTFSFLGQQGKVKNSDDWVSAEHSRLWLYNLHYFDVLNTLPPKKCVSAAATLNEKEQYHQSLVQFMDKWIQENPPFRAPAWEPYPLSLRIVNWVKWLARHPEFASKNRLRSLAQQGQALNQQIEYHIQANHLFANAKALVFIGAYFQNHRFLKKGLDLLDKEIKKQFLPDGGHFERAVMYHAIVLWDVCDLYHLAACSGCTELIQRQIQWQEVIVKGLNWLQNMIHPDGDFAFFNDTALDIAPRYQDLLDYTRILNIEYQPAQATSLNHLKQSGFISVSRNNLKAILDVGPVGPDIQPGHAHADTLSFELSLFGFRFIVNSGISEYGDGPVRQYQRSTSAHNTVCINKQNSSEVWAGFRVARRALPIDLKTQETDTIKEISCGHNGYLRLPSKNLHHRSWSIESHKIIIHDAITGQFDEAKAYLFLHPDIKILHASAYEIACRLPNEKKASILLKSPGKLELLPSQWHATFGSSDTSHCIELTFKVQHLSTWIVWS